MHVLDEKNTVLNLILPRVLSHEDCIAHLNATKKILDKSNRVYIGGAGSFDEPREKSEYKYTFPKLGAFAGNGRILNYWAIWNDYGQCYDVMFGKEKPCPREKFPIKKSTSP